MGGVAGTYQVVTWLGISKAIVLAVQEHAHRHPSRPIFDVEVTEQPLDGANLRSDDLVDRLEW